MNDIGTDNGANDDMIEIRNDRKGPKPSRADCNVYVCMYIYVYIYI